MTCKTCKYWIAPDKDEWDTVFKIVGECNAAAFHADMGDIIFDKPRLHFVDRAPYSYNH
jgi:hypothetical protein